MGGAKRMLKLSCYKCNCHFLSEGFSQEIIVDYIYNEDKKAFIAYLPNLIKEDLICINCGQILDEKTKEKLINNTNFIKR